MRAALALLLLALPVHAEAIRLGARADRAIHMVPYGASSAASITLDAMPYTRTVTCGTYYQVVTSTDHGTAMTWNSQPSNTNGVCSYSAGDIWDCAVTVTPDAVGEGVETVTITQGTATGSFDVGFYVASAHSCFLSQNVNGSYNTGLANLDAVATWENVGTSALDVTQGTGAAQPTFRTSIVGGQPVVRCDGGDRLAASTASDWTFLNDSADWSMQVVYATSAANPNAAMAVVTTQSSFTFSNSRGHSTWYDDRVAVPANERGRQAASNGTVYLWNLSGADGGLPAAKFNDQSFDHDNDGGAGIDATQYSNNAVDGTAIVSAAYSALAPGAPLTFCSQGGVAASWLTGDLFRVLIYQSALTSTQRGINKAVDEWALGGTLPVTP